MSATTHELNGWTILVSGTRLDAGEAPSFEREAAAIAGEERTKLILDLGKCEYISSAGLRSILKVAKAARNGGGEVRVAGLRGLALEVFTISGFDKIILSFDSVSSAAA